MTLPLSRLLRGKRNLISFFYPQKIFGNFESSDVASQDKSENIGSFAKAYMKHSHINDIPSKTETEDISFSSLMRNSKFIDLGDPNGRIVTGTVFHVVEDDLYIDFGWKFHCVCKRPSKNGSDYMLGSKVRIRIKDLELSTKFLGSDTDLTILEADAILLGLVSSVKSTTDKS